MLFRQLYHAPCPTLPCALRWPLPAGSFTVGPFTVPAGADKAKLKVKVMLNLNGVVVVESAQLIEEEEVEEEVPAAGAAPAADQPMADAEDSGAAAGAAKPPAAGADAAGTAGEPAPMAEDTAAAAPAKVIKKKVKKHAVPFSSHTAALSRERLQQLEEEEAELALQVRAGGRASCVSYEHRIDTSSGVCFERQGGLSTPRAGM